MKKKNLNDLNELYSNVLKSVNLYADNEGYIKAPSLDGDKSNDMQMLHNKLPLVLPTESNNKTIMSLDDDTKQMKRIKFLFNPLYENILSGDNASLVRLKKFIEVNTCAMITNTMTSLLEISGNNTKQKKASLYLQSLISTLGTSATKNKKSMVDEKTLSNWDVITDRANSGTFAKEGVAHYYLKKGGKYKGESYVRLCTLKFPLFDLLDNVDKDKKVLNYKLRRDDIEVFKKLYTAILSDLPLDNENYLDNMVLTYGSNHDKSPGFVSMYTLYLMIHEKITKIAKDILKVTTNEYLDNVISKVPFKYTDIVDIADDLHAIVEIVPKDAVNVSTSATESINRNIDNKSKVGVTQQLINRRMNTEVRKVNIPTRSNVNTEVTMTPNQINVQNNVVPHTNTPAVQNQGTRNVNGIPVRDSNVTKNLAASLTSTNNVGANYSINNNPVNIRYPDNTFQNGQVPMNRPDPYGQPQQQNVYNPMQQQQQIVVPYGQQQNYGQQKVAPYNPNMNNGAQPYGQNQFNQMPYEVKSNFGN